MLTDVRKPCQGSEVQKACSGRLLDIDLDFHALLLCNDFTEAVSPQLSAVSVLEEFTES